MKGRSGSGPYTLTLDRPVMSQFGAGDEVSVFNAIPTGHRILGRPTVTGRGTRMFEFICTIGCEADVIFMPDEVEDVVGSFDTFGHSNNASGIIRINGSGAIDGFYLETQENSVTAFDEVSGFTGVGVSHFDCTGCDDYSFVTACGAGIAQRGDGNVKGCNDCGVYGTYNSNTGTGIEIVNGSRNAKVKAVARFNPTNLALGDGAGGNVTNPYVEGLFDGATVAGITVFSSVLGAKAGAIDTSGSAFGINAQGNIQIAAWTHTGTAANGALLNTGVVVTITKVDINTTSAVSVIKTTGSGLTTVNGGSIVAANNSNIFYSADTAISFIGSVTGSSGGAFSVGAYAEAGARVVLLPGANFSGCNTETGGDGTKQIYAEWRKLLTRTVASVGTDANTTEKTLQNYTIPANLLKAGQKVVVRAWGTTANNANVKTLRVKFGGTAVIDQALPTSAAAGWVAESEFFITGTDTQDYLASVKAAGTTTPSAGSLTKDDGSTIAVLVTGLNGTASANDIVCRGLEVIHMSA